MVLILERVQAHYESRELPFGKVYEWCPAHVALECDCGEKVTLSATSTTTTCSRCGAELGTFVNEMAQEVLWRQARALAREPEDRSSRRWRRSSRPRPVGSSKS